MKRTQAYSERQQSQHSPSSRSPTSTSSADIAHGRRAPDCAAAIHCPFGLRRGPEADADFSTIISGIFDPLFALIGGPRSFRSTSISSHSDHVVAGLGGGPGGRRPDLGRLGARAGASRRSTAGALRSARPLAWCILILTFTTSYEVFARYLFLAPTEWAFDASYMLYGTLFMMAGAYALSRNAHVRGDFLYRAWPPRRQAGLDLVLYFLFFFPGMLAFVYAGYGFAELSWHDERALRRQPQRPDRMAVQIAHRRRRRADGDPGHRRGRCAASSACATANGRNRLA